MSNKKKFYTVRKNNNSDLGIILPTGYMIFNEGKNALVSADSEGANITNETPEQIKQEVETFTNVFRPELRLLPVIAHCMQAQNDSCIHGMRSKVESFAFGVSKHSENYKQFFESIFSEIYHEPEASFETMLGLCKRLKLRTDFVEGINKRLTGSKMMYANSLVSLLVDELIEETGLSFSAGNYVYSILTDSALQFRAAVILTESAVLLVKSDAEVWYVALKELMYANLDSEDTLLNLNTSDLENVLNVFRMYMLGISDEILCPSGNSLMSNNTIDIDCSFSKSFFDKTVVIDDKVQKTPYIPLPREAAVFRKLIKEDDTHLIEKAVREVGMGFSLITAIAGMNEDMSTEMTDTIRDLGREYAERVYDDGKSINLYMERLLEALSDHESRMQMQILTGNCTTSMF